VKGGGRDGLGAVCAGRIAIEAGDVRQGEKEANMIERRQKPENLR
jgi:hypothetical protein